MPDLVTLTIDGQPVSVPKGMLVVDAAKQIGNDIPVFCYHPKMEPVGMCRMCLVSIGRPAVDRATNQPILNEDGTPKIAFSPKLETACTTPVSEGMVVVTQSEPVVAARKEILEFLLTSHPLDCPICDKGGECPLQNLTMAYGPGKSRFLLDEKIRLAKHYPLGELIFLDRERCIQCARCIRFQDEIVDDPVIGFAQRGRALEIITFSDPGFDSYFSGNTTDICPVGALTTADFRFNARPWELNAVASVCNHCPVGCNTTLNIRREAAVGGGVTIKRIMPRQNEQVNEIWICDKGRFAYHYTEAGDRLAQPLVRQNGELVPVTWDEAFEAAAAGLRDSKGSFVTLAGGRLTNEDLFALRKLSDGMGGQSILDSRMGGGDLTARFGLPPGSNFKDMGAGTTIMVVACDLQEEAPVWFLRVKQAVDRGAKLIVVNGRHTKLERYTPFNFRYEYGQELEALRRLFPPELGGAAQEPESDASADVGHQAMESLRDAANTVIFFGSDGAGLETTTEIARLCADLLDRTGHAGKVNSGLLGVWEKGNVQGAWELGFRPAPDLAGVLSQARGVYIAAADPAGDDPHLADALDQAGFVVVQEFFLTETARRADVVFPAQVFSEREGSYTSGERMVQRFYAAIPTRPTRTVPTPLPDFAITARLAARLNVHMEGRAAILVFQELANEVPAYAGLTYQKLAEVTPQWPIIGRQDLYYGGTQYQNSQGLGVRLSPTVSAEEFRVEPPAPAAAGEAPAGFLKLVPVSRLYDQGRLMRPTKLLYRRVAPAAVWLHPDTAAQYGLQEGEPVEFTADGLAFTAGVCFDETAPLGVGLVPRSVGIPLESMVYMKAASRSEAAAGS